MPSFPKSPMIALMMVLFRFRIRLPPQDLPFIQFQIHIIYNRFSIVADRHTPSFNNDPILFHFQICRDLVIITWMSSQS